MKKSSVISLRRKICIRGDVEFADSTERSCCVSLYIASCVDVLTGIWSGGSTTAKHGWSEMARRESSQSAINLGSELDRD
jgi:hypothetical protein